MTREKSHRDVVLERALGNLLRTGVLISAAIVVAGAAVLLIHRGGSPVTGYRHFERPPEQLRSVHGIVRGALTLDARSIIQFGLLVLIATPVLRVAASLVGFAVEGDLLYVGITALVLAVLAYSLSGGRGI